MAESQDGMKYKKLEINQNVKNMILHIGDILWKEGFRSTMVRENPTAKSNVRLLPEPVRMAQSTVTRLCMWHKDKETGEMVQNEPKAAIDLIALEKVCQLLHKQPAELFAGLEFDLDETLSLEYYFKEGKNESENQ